jgi:hypothetical protein
MTAVNNAMHRNQPLPLQSGQIWQMKDSHVRIEVVGKTLVHYKHFKGQAKRSPNSLSGKAVLEKFLRVHKAVLIQPQPASKPGRALRP